MKPSILIKIGAACDSVTVDGIAFDRSEMDHPTKRKLSRMIVDGLRKVQR